MSERDGFANKQASQTCLLLLQHLSAGIRRRPALKYYPALRLKLNTVLTQCQYRVGIT